MSKELFIVINEDRFLLSHRREIAVQASLAGYDVTVVARDTGRSEEIRSLGVKFLPLPIQPRTISARSDLHTMTYLARLYRHHPGAIVHHVGMKVILIGTAAARAAGNVRIVNAVSGLGNFFAEESYKTRAVFRFLKFVTPKTHLATIFQNSEDSRIFKRNGIPVGIEVYTKGSGTDLEQFHPSDRSAHSPLTVVFAGRMLRQKGVEDVVAAASLLKKKWDGRVKFLLCGDVTDNSGSLSAQLMDDLTDGDYIRWIGHVEDMAPILSTADIMLFPSYYREGFPKCLIDASAAGLPIVTTDSVGCRDAVEEGVNGYIVPICSPERIADALEKLLDDADLRLQFGRESRRIAERDYSVAKVVDSHLSVYATV